MTITASRKWAILLLSLSLTACGAGLADQEVIIQKLPKAQADTLKVHTLTITQVKTPWYASRAMVVNRMRKTIPEYQLIKGLRQKMYAFTENRQLFGGIYLWESEPDARAWFNQAWFEKTEKKYGKKGEVAYYEVLSIQNTATSVHNEGKYWAVLSSVEAKLSPEAHGLLKIITLKDAKEKRAFLTLWQNKATAEKYFAESIGTHTYFDTPILLDNTKNK
jgi:heme-degrading monooxygenase HmoA